MDYFTGKALQYEVDEDDEFDDDDDDVLGRDNASSGSGSEPDSESDGYAAPRAGGGRGNAPQKVRHSTNSNPEECKQQ